MQELAAEARRWRGEALLAQGRREEGSKDLRRAASAADEIGRPRLAADARAALAISGLGHSTDAIFERGL